MLVVMHIAAVSAVGAAHSYALLQLLLHTAAHNCSWCCTRLQLMLHTAAYQKVYFMNTSGLLHGLSNQ